MDKAHGLYKLFKQTDEGARQKQVSLTVFQGSARFLHMCLSRRLKSLGRTARAWALVPALKPEQL